MIRLVAGGASGLGLAPNLGAIDARLAAPAACAAILADRDVPCPLRGAARSPRWGWAANLAARGSALCRGRVASVRRRAPARRCSISPIRDTFAASTPSPPAGPACLGAPARVLLENREHLLPVRDRFPLQHPALDLLQLPPRMS